VQAKGMISYLVALAMIIFGGVGNDRLNGFLGSDTCNGGSSQDFGASCEIEISIP
jgi:hypothetical protein